MTISLKNSITTTFHKAPYPAIDPSQPKVSAAAKTILITAGHTGIGKSIAQNFGAAGASNVIILGRRKKVLENAVEKLQASFPKTKFHSFPASIEDYPAIEKVTKEIRATIGDIDILVTSAAYMAGFSNAIDLPMNELASSINTNFLGNANLVREFLGDFSPASSKSAKKEKVVIDISTAGIHLGFSTKLAAYSASKIAFTQWLAQLQLETMDQGVRIHSVHPGAVFTDAAVGQGFEETTLEFDDVQLPGRFVVWLSSGEGRFLKGRFVWCNWDVTELEEMREEFENNEKLLKIGLMH